ncbi:MAG: DUF2807 domain-containing protein [Muribaculaceae bacterium]|nr:DUF2807 domain-containing protein [Muribaculaceae bacterium]
MNKFLKIALAAIIATGYSSVDTMASAEEDFNLFGFGERIEASSKNATRNITVDGSYDELKVTRGITVNFTAGKGKTTAKVSGPENLVELASVKVEKGVLKVSFTKEFNLKGKNIVVDITGALPSEYKGSAGATINVNSDVKKPGTLEVSGSAGADVNFNGKVSGGTIEVSASAGAGVNFNGDVKVHSGEVKASAGGAVNINSITAGDLELKASAGGEVTASGTAKRVNAKASAGGEVNIKGLKSDSCNVKASAGGEVKR